MEGFHLSFVVLIQLFKDIFLKLIIEHADILCLSAHRVHLPRAGGCGRFGWHRAYFDHALLVLIIAMKVPVFKVCGLKSVVFLFRDLVFTAEFISVYCCNFNLLVLFVLRRRLIEQ